MDVRVSKDTVWRVPRINNSGFWWRLVLYYFRPLEYISYKYAYEYMVISQIARLMGPTWGPPGSCRPQMGPMLAQCTLLSGMFFLFINFQLSHLIHLTISDRIASKAHDDHACIAVPKICHWDIWGKLQNHNESNLLMLQEWVSSFLCVTTASHLISLFLSNVDAYNEVCHGWKLQ